MHTMRRNTDGVYIKVTNGQRVQLLSTGYATDVVSKKSNSNVVDATDSVESDATAKTVRRGRPRKNSNNS